MGLFDTLEVEYKLPMPDDMGETNVTEVQNLFYQTKDLDEAMCNYRFDKIGQLWREKVTYKDRDLSEPGNIWSISLQVDTREWIKNDHTGSITFYDGLYKEQNDYWIEYNCDVYRGLIKNIGLVKWDVSDNYQRLAREAEWRREALERKIYTNTLRFKYCLSFWNKGVRWLFRNIRRFQEWMTDFIWNLERWITF